MLTATSGLRAHHKLFCHNMHCRKSDTQAHSKIVMTLIPFTKTCVCVQEVTEKQDHNASKKFVFNRGLGWSWMGRDSCTMFATWSTCIKFSHWKHQL